MRTIGTEEHFVTAELTAAWERLDPVAFEDSIPRRPPDEIAESLNDLGDRRLATMDAFGLDVQVLSVNSPGLNVLPPAEATALQVHANDLIADTVARRPDRFQSLATLAATAPEQAAGELGRAVATLGFQGGMLFCRTGDRNLEHADNWPIFEAAEALGAPLYVHPQISQPPVRDGLYSGFGTAVDQAFATVGVGWHYEAGIQFLRLALAGVFDRFPDLQIILGHWGEVVLFYLDRIDDLAQVAKLPRRFSEYARTNLFVTPGGIWSTRYLEWTVGLVGIDRILMAADYPYRPAPDGGIAGFLESSGLAPDDQQRIAAGNWDALTARIRR